ncbi:MAG: hypothetical protein JXB50_02990 [Spirochaetes bacterium]|nr:hypothetical protein [Spirochaetota bacterium]
MTIETLLIIPIILSIIMIIFRFKIINRICIIINAILFIVAPVLYYFNKEFIKPFNWLLKYFSIDALSFLFFSVMAVVNFGISFYTIFYFKSKDYSNKHDTLFSVLYLLFLICMTGVILSSHLAITWIFIEATTLTGTLLIYLEKEKSSLEAAWKYIFISSIGVSFAYVGIILLSMGNKSGDSLFFVNLYKNAANFTPLWLKLSFAFILVGFGTKVGLAPVHAWLPDAHSEASSPISALFSGTLLNAALIGILKFYKIMINAQMESYAKILLLSMGFLSLLVSAVFVLKVKNYKRMLAYSSIENMGIIVIGIGLGSTGFFASLYHLTAHSLSKSSMFLTTGNIYHHYHSKKINEVKGLLSTDKISGWIWIFSFIAISGFPPFPAFMSKFMLIETFFKKGLSSLAVPFFLFLIIILFGMGKTVFLMSAGSGNAVKNKNLNIFAYIPQVFYLALLLIIGTVLPDFIKKIIQSAADFF